MTTTSTDAYQEAAVAASSTARKEPAWLTDRRLEAARAFAALPMPTPQLRPWRYTDIVGLDLTAHAPADAAITVQGAAPKGGYAGTLSGALGSFDEVVQQHLGSVVTSTEGKFAAANAAHWTPGAFVYAPKGKAFEAPVVVTVSAGSHPDRAIYPRLLVVTEEQSDVTIVLRTVSGEAPLLAAGVVEVVAGQASRVRVLLDERWGGATQEFSTVRSRLAKDADVHVATLVIGGKTVKQTIEGELVGEGATSVIRGVALGDRDQHFDFVTLQDHIGPKTVSDVEIKSALAGASRSIYYGVTRVGEGAAGSDANQRNRNLLLSDKAKADSDPVLEILIADVVRCGHGATVGPVDQEALFYLQSRGLDYRTSLQLLIYGFFQSVAEDIEVPGVTDELYELVVDKLAQADLGR
jgi:Fe-S cluster assembly protein SufD